jgi:leucyl-tRNA synthetase
VAVNWCPGLGTVLANEEVIDGKSEVGGFPVERRPMRQWMLRITAYADRLVEDLRLLDWPESLKEMQRNWIGRSVGAEVDFEIAEEASPSRPEEDDGGAMVTVFTTRPDTLYGATYMVLAPEHPLVGRITTEGQRAAVEAYKASVAAKSERDRMAETKEKSGVFTGAYAINPVNEEKIPVWIADYVLMGYGTGAIMAVPAHDERDFEFAKKFGLPIRRVVAPAGAPVESRGKTLTLPASGQSPIPLASPGVPGEGSHADAAFVGEGVAVNSPEIDGLSTAAAKEKIIDLLEDRGVWHRSVKYKLRDWLFSRQRYWGEPFPIVLDAEGNAYPIEESELPLTLPELADFKPTGTPAPPLSKAVDWIKYTNKAGESFTRETNTMPQWAGSCWYYLRYIDPRNPGRFVDPEKEAYWMPVDLYIGGVEHAVLHLLYSRFWHKVLFDLGHVSTPEPFGKLVNQGLILGEMEYHFFEDRGGKAVSVSDVRDIDEEAGEAGVTMFGFHKQTGERLTAKRLEEVLVEKRGDTYVSRANPAVRVDARSFTMCKSRGYEVNPVAIVKDYGADTFRLYEMYLGPLEQQKPWNTRDIVGMSRFLDSVWRNLIGEDRDGQSPAEGSTRIGGEVVTESLERMLHRATKKVAEDIEGLRFNVAIAELIKVNNEVKGLAQVPKGFAERFALLLAPFAPHIAEEIWHRLGHENTLTREPWPKYDPAMLVDANIELPVQVNGKLRGRISVAADAAQESILEAAKGEASVRPWVEGKTMVKELYVQGKLVNFVVK